MKVAPLSERGVIETARRAAVTAVSRTGVRVGIGDDCAVLESSAQALLLATTDLLVEDVDFRRRYAEPADIGWKALAVNLSDIASMGGQPRWALLGLGCPDSTSPEDIESFYEGLSAIAALHGVALVGGDTSAAPCWMISITLLGEATRPLLRSTARPGDVVAVTGTLGNAAGGLAVLHRAAAPPDLPADVLSALTSAQLRPVPRVLEGRWLGETAGITSMIDVSDGIATDLGHIAEESRVGARVEVERLPVSEAVRRTAKALGVDALTWATRGGEDYELLLTCEPETFARCAEGLHRSTGTSLHAIGEIVGAHEGVRFVDGRGEDVAIESGFQHFSRPERRTKRMRPAPRR